MVDFYFKFRIEVECFNPFYCKVLSFKFSLNPYDYCLLALYQGPLNIGIPNNCFFFYSQSFKDVKVVPRQGGAIVESMAKEIEMMMDLKVSAVRVCLF